MPEALTVLTMLTAFIAFLIFYKAHTNVKVNLIDPGVVRTHMRASAMPGEDPSRLQTPDSITGIFLKLASPECTETGKRFLAQK